MEIFIEKENKTIKKDISGKVLIKDILKEFKISSSSCIIVKNNKVVLDSSLIGQNDKIELLSVVSGG